MTLLLGLMIGAPAGAFLAFIVATVLAAIPAVGGSGKMRIVAIAILLIAAGLAAVKFADFKSDQARYRSSAKCCRAGSLLPLLGGLALAVS